MSEMRPRATLQGEVGYTLRAGENPFSGWTRPAGRMLLMPGLYNSNLPINEYSTANLKETKCLFYHFKQRPFT